MKKIICTLLWLGAQRSYAQPVVNNAGETPIGTVLTFMPCDENNVYAGSGGANKTWNFSSLAGSGDTLVTTIVTPASTSAGSLFPMATVAEINSDETINYITRTQGKSFIAGFADTSSNGTTVQYQQMIQIQQNPVSYGNVFTGSSASTYTLILQGYTFRGTGSYTLNADAYGTLILPNGTHNNVLRLKLSSVAYDTLAQGGGTYTTNVVNYMFFDGIHTASLLNIDSVTNGSFVQKTVKYLLQESGSPAVGLIEHKKAALYSCYPNPAHDYIIISSQETGELLIKNVLGESIKSAGIASEKTTIGLDNLPPGVYFIEFKTKTGYYKNKLLIN